MLMVQKSSGLHEFFGRWFFLPTKHPDVIWPNISSISIMNIAEHVCICIHQDTHIYTKCSISWILLFRDLNTKKSSHWKRHQNLKVFVGCPWPSVSVKCVQNLLHLGQRDVSLTPRSNKSSLTCAPWGCDDVHIGSSSSVPMPWNWYSAWFPNSAAANKKPVFNTLFWWPRSCSIHKNRPKNGSFVKVSFPKRND